MSSVHQPHISEYKILTGHNTVELSEAVERAIKRVDSWIGAQPGWQTLGIIASPIKGQHGNKEYLISASYAK